MSGVNKVLIARGKVRKDSTGCYYLLPDLFPSNQYAGAGGLPLGAWAQPHEDKIIIIYAEEGFPNPLPLPRRLMERDE